MRPGEKSGAREDLNLAWDNQVSEHLSQVDICKCMGPGQCLSLTGKNIVAAVCAISMSQLLEKTIAKCSFLWTCVLCKEDA